MQNILTYIVDFIPTIIAHEFILFFVGSFIIASLFGIVIMRFCK